MTLKYRSGEDIKDGDRVRFHDKPAEIKFVAHDITGNPQTDWFVEEYGGGVMVSDPMVSGDTFIPADHIANYEDLEFVSRNDSHSK